MGELGPMRLPVNMLFLHHLVDKLKLKLEKFQSEDSYKYYHIRGEKHQGTAFKTPQGRKSFYEEYDVAKNESLKSIFHVMDNIFQSAVEDLHKLDWRDFIVKYDEYSLKRYLDENGVSSGLSDLVGVALNSETIMSVGVLEFILDECLFQQDLEMIVGGMDQLPRNLYNEELKGW